MLVVLCSVFLFKHKTAYELRISDWSSDVGSSDLDGIASASADGRVSVLYETTLGESRVLKQTPGVIAGLIFSGGGRYLIGVGRDSVADRKSDVTGTGVSVGLDLGGRCTIQNTNATHA